MGTGHEGPEYQFAQTVDTLLCSTDDMLVKQFSFLPPGSELEET